MEGKEAEGEERRGRGKGRAGGYSDDVNNSIINKSNLFILKIKYIELYRNFGNDNEYFP